MVTDDLSKFGYRELKQAETLLHKLADSSVETYEGLKLNFNTHSGCVFLGNDGGQAFVIGGNETLCEFDTDDYGREIYADVNLKYGDKAQEMQKATLIRSELLEFEEVINDHNEYEVANALKELDKDAQQTIKALKHAVENINGYDEEITDNTVDELSNAFDCINLGNDIYKAKDEIQDAIQALKIELEC